MDDHDLIDTSEMYLKAVLELEEEGVPALRARLVERFEQSGPTVSQTVDRLRRNDLLELGGERQLLFTATGRSTAGRIMRKHRLAEVFLHQVVGLEWPLLHVEACRWEHVISDHAESLMDLRLGHPRHSPYGNPITRENDPADAQPLAVASLVQHATRPDLEVPAWIAWIGEPLQADPHALTELLDRGLTPGAAITVTGSGRTGVLLANGAELPNQLAKHIFVSQVAPDLSSPQSPEGRQLLTA